MRRISIEALSSSREEILRLRGLLDAGGVAVVPTETFYGFAVEPRSEEGVRRVMDAKGRDGGKAFPVLFRDADHLRALGVTASEESLAPFFEIWPAPLTVVLPLRQPIAASRGASTLAVRIPAQARLRRLLASTGPLTATSVNRSGSPPLDDPDAIAAAFGDEIDLLIEGGKTPGGAPSTILDATQNPARVLRAGAFAWPA